MVHFYAPFLNKKSQSRPKRNMQMKKNLTSKFKMRQLLCIPYPVSRIPYPVSRIEILSAYSIVQLKFKINEKGI